MVYLVSMTVTFLCSAIYHLFNDHSEHLSGVLSRCDYAGIANLMAGASVPPFYYIFYCTPPFPTLYISGIYIASLLTFLTTLRSDFDQPAFLKQRGLIFLTLGVVSFLPIFHFLLDLNYYASFSYSMVLYACVGLNNVFAVTLYLSKMPERIWPG
jgi:adiponectin receptor